MINDITLQQIEIFLTVSEQLNLSEAAKDLFLNQSAVSRWISRLEQSLGVQLFYRSNKGVELTETGEYLYEKLQPMYEKLHYTLQNIRDNYDISDDIINVGCLDVPEIIAGLKCEISKFGDIDSDKLFKLHLLTSKDLREELLCGNLDFIMAYKYGFGTYMDISIKNIKKLDTYIAVSKHGRLANFDDFPSAEALSKETLCLLSNAEMKETESRALKLCELKGFQPKEIKYLPNYSCLELLVKNDKGFCLAGPGSVESISEDLKVCKHDCPHTDQYAIVAWHKNKVSDQVKGFLDSLPDLVV